MMPSLKILHISTSDSSGGAARASYRIHEALVKYGVNSFMRVIQKNTDDERVIGGKQHRSSFSRLIERFQYKKQEYAHKGWHTDDPILHTFGYTSAGLVDELNSSDADMLNLHWIADMLSVSDIGRLQKPIVWTLHDMWPFCGGEHYAPDEESARFRQGYFANRPPGERGPDLNRITWETKRLAWSRQQFTIVSPSQWLADCAHQSLLLARMPIHVIPNPLDMTDTWRPIPCEAARVALGLPLEKKLILMGAHGGVSDPRKGGDILLDAMAQVVTRHSCDVELVICGQGRPGHDDDWPCPVHWLGRVIDDRVLVLAYSAADVVVVPSRQDNLPNAAVEAQACGTPVAAFNVGGLPDIVAHCKTGWLANAFDPSHLADGIVWLLEDKERHAIVAAAARRQALERYSEPVVAVQYAGLYRQVHEEACRK
jgi:glycosyltransferase involved in cell wall biosynthesis